MTERSPYAWLLTDLDSVPRTGVKVMSTFACGGGSSMGYKLAGCDVIAANDIDPEMAWHYKTNLHPATYYPGSIQSLLTAELPPELYALDILDGSPPCSSFSTARATGRSKIWGKNLHFREGQQAQVLDDLFFQWIELVAKLRPKVAIGENVTGIIKGNAKGYAAQIVSTLAQHGYACQIFQINAADCGVPQRRERVFFLARRDDLGKPDITLAPKAQWISTTDACRDLTPTPAEREKLALTSPMDLMWWPKCLPGQLYSEAVAKTGAKKKYWSHVRMPSNKPGNTLVATHISLKHWSEMRYMTLSEWKRLGSFPDDYVVQSDNIGKYLIGMSVPPKMMEVVARAVCSQWLGVSYA